MQSLPCMVNILKLQTLVACQKGLDKQTRPRSDCFWRSSLIRVFPVCYSDKKSVNSSSENQNFFENQYTWQTQNRLLLKKQFDQGLPCLLFWQEICEFQHWKPNFLENQQTWQTQNRLLLKKQSDQGLPCLLFWQEICGFQLWNLHWILEQKKCSKFLNIYHTMYMFCICYWALFQKMLPVLVLESSINSLLYYIYSITLSYVMETQPFMS